MPFVNGQYQADTRSPMQRLFDVQKMQAQMQQLRAQQDLEEQRKRILQESYTPAQDARTEYSFDQPQAQQQPVSFAGSAPNIAAALGIAEVPQMQTKQIEAKPAAFDTDSAIARLYGAGDLTGAQSLVNDQYKDTIAARQNGGNGAYGSTFVPNPDKPGEVFAAQYSRNGGLIVDRSVSLPEQVQFLNTGNQFTPVTKSGQPAPAASAIPIKPSAAQSATLNKPEKTLGDDGKVYWLRPGESLPDGVKAAGGGGSSASQASEDERKAAGWVAQARTSMQNMQDALAQDPSADSPSTGEKVAGLFGAEGAVQSEARQRYATAASSFAEAALRAATGAGVNEQEAKQKINELTPTYFDKPATKAQKWRQLQMYLDSLEARAGRALPMVKVQPPSGSPAAGSAPQSKPAASAPKPGTMKGGYVFMGGNPADPKSWRKM